MTEQDRDQCAIWGTKLQTPRCIPFDRNGVPADLYEMDSPRAGGVYRIDDMIVSCGTIGKWSNDDKVKLTDWLVEQRENGVEKPLITSRILEDVRTRPKTFIRTRLDRALRYCEEVGAFSDYIEVLDDPQNAHSPTMMARCSCARGGELMTILDALKSSHQAHIIEKSKNHIGSPPGHRVKVTALGIQRLEDIASVNPESRIGFIAMWFGGSKCKPLMDDVKNAVAKGIKEATFEPIRIDDTQHNGKIDDEIIATIRKSRFVIADMTHGADGPRGGVYYEAGFARGLGLEVIFTCQESAIGDVHFDTRQYNHILWNENELDELSEAIRLRIGATV